MRVPEYPNRQVAPGGMPGVRVPQQAPLDAFGGGGAVDQAFGQTAGLGQDVARQAYREVREQQQQADEIQLADATAKLADFERNILYGKDGAFSRQGENAFTLGESVPKDFQKGVADIASGLKSERARQAFRNMALGREKQALDRVGRHVMAQRERYDDEKTLALVDSSDRLAVDGYADIETVQRSLADQEGAIIARARREGVSAEEATRRVMIANSRTTRNVISRALDAGDSDLAKSYFVNAEKGGFLTPQDRAALAGDVAKGESLGAARKASDRIFATTANEEDAIAEARKIPNTDVSDEVIKRIENRYATEKRLRNEAHKATLNESLRMVSDPRRPGASAADILKGGRWNAMDTSERREAETLFRQNRGLEAVKTDLGTLYGLKRMASIESEREKFKQLDLMRYASKLEKTDFEELSKLQDGLIRGDEKARADADGFRGTDSIVSGALRVAQKAGKIPLDDKGGIDDVEEEAFRRMVDKQIRLEQKLSKDGKVPNERVQEIVDGLLSSVVTGDGTFSDTEEPVYKARARREAEMQRAVPASARADIESRLRARGYPVSDDIVLRIYLMKREEEAKNAPK